MSQHNVQFIGDFWQFLDENWNIGNRIVSHIIISQSSAPSWLTPQLSFGDRWQQKRLLDGKLIPLTLVLAQCIEFHLFWINSKKKQIHYKLEKYNTNTSVIKDSVVGWSPWQMAPLPDCQLSSLLPLVPLHNCSLFYTRTHHKYKYKYKKTRLFYTNIHYTGIDKSTNALKTKLNYHKRRKPTN